MSNNREPYEILYDWVVLEYKLKIPSERDKALLELACKVMLENNSGRNPEEYIEGMGYYVALYGLT